jgi:DNA repair protein RadC
LEATLATLSSSGIYNLIERFFAHRRQSQGTVFDIVRVEYPAVRRLVDERTPATGAEDNAWLRRTELRGQDAVIRYLEQNPVDLTRCLLALFVDERCGLIAYSCIGTSREITLSGTAARILQDASHHHSCAIILASNWSNPNLPNADREKLTVELFRKGEAIGIYLLDHFVRTPSGWSRMFAISEAQRP